MTRQTEEQRAANRLRMARLRAERSGKDTSTFPQRTRRPRSQDNRYQTGLETWREDPPYESDVLDRFLQEHTV